jgi:hypothetical protein
MGNKISGLPMDVDSTLQDLAQMFEVDGISLDYNDIIDFANAATSNDINEVRDIMANLSDLDYMIDEDDDAAALFVELVETVRGVEVC